ncbi:sensor histidine kinase [Saccharopolyspora phatthalungensis]|uniref:histidine kinase n=1 Tax=Saccharopolyspora phatthalungensis TaxID=664693 RepID=A0A840Q0B2_9PSEU|nr:HAMP domain-containing sensor histidine kinase [Saccharopolyspora phatthalungensis]MBB5153437.1 signal transduction histidine kinase [Saccharopolyspora phatthalungensis]
MISSLRRWWHRRTIQFRTSVVAAVVALIGLGVIAHASTGIVSWLLINSVDADLQRTAATTASQLAGGAAPATVANPDIRVLDTSGAPLDGLPRPSLHRWQIDELRSGDGVIDFDPPAGLYRWRGVVVPDPTGQPLLISTGAKLVGFADTAGKTGRLLSIGSILAAALVGLATWLVVRRSLRPVERMRVAAAGLPEGRRLPVPEAADEIRALAEELNTMLARRDADTERLRRFTGDAAHELRNPVASIRAQAEVAVMHPDPELAHETLQDIAHEAQRLSALVESLLALARAERGTAAPGQPLDLGTAVRAAADRLELPTGSGPRIEVEVPARPVLILADPAEVSTVLDNIVSNALRYTSTLVRVSVFADGMGSSGVDWVRLVVDDDGPGIPVAHRERVFDRFHRVEPDRARSTGGAGLGLALAAEAVRRRGGAVCASTAPDGGARVEARWPRHTANGLTGSP